MTMALTQVSDNGLTNTGVTAATYGSSSAIPSLTIDAKGRVTSATTSAIDSTSISNGTSNVSVANNGDITLVRAGSTQATVDASGIKLDDSHRIALGDSSDLKLYHDGSNSYIDEQGTGNLNIRAYSQINFDKYTGEALARFRADGNCELFYDNSSKLTTKSDGVDITGELQCDTLDVDGNADINGELSVNRAVLRDNGAASPTLQVRTDDTSPWAVAMGNDSYSTTTTVGWLFYQATNGDIHHFGRGDSEYVSYYITQSDNTNTTVGIHLDRNRAVHLNYQGNTKLSTKNNGVNVTGEVECDALGVGSTLQQGNVASFKGGSENQVNIADSTNSSWGLLLSQSQGVTNTSSYHYSTNSGENKPCAIVNVNGDALHFGTNNTARFRVEHDGHVVPSSNNSYDLGSSSYRWRNVYTNDLNLSNEGSTNDVDGTWGSWTIQEGEDDLFLLNRRNGKKYKFNLTEVN